MPSALPPAVAVAESTWGAPEPTLYFDFEDYVQNQLGVDLKGENKKWTENGVCKFYLKASCARGVGCPYKHSRLDRSVVCKHWLRGLCKKGDLCEFLHQYNLKKMPECWFYTKYGECSNGDECLYLHVDPDSRTRECPWYNRGFCKLGPQCRRKHVRRVLCELYLTGFCPQGQACPNAHPKWEIPETDGDEEPVKVRRNLAEVTCFKCGQKGHYANRCING